MTKSYQNVFSNNSRKLASTGLLIALRWTNASNNCLETSRDLWRTLIRPLNNTQKSWRPWESRKVDENPWKSTFRVTRAYQLPCKLSFNLTPLVDFHFFFQCSPIWHKKRQMSTGNRQPSTPNSQADLSSANRCVSRMRGRICIVYSDSDNRDPGL